MFGLDRTSRALPVETIRLLEQAPARFLPCEGDWRSCIEDTPAITIHNDSTAPVLCGEVGLLRRAPPPWAWASLMDREDMPTDTLKLEITCDERA